jgi:hypothetical protein
MGRGIHPECLGRQLPWLVPAMVSMAQGCGVVLIALLGHVAAWVLGSERQEREGRSGGERKRASQF